MPLCSSVTMTAEVHTVNNPSIPHPPHTTPKGKCDLDWPVTQVHCHYHVCLKRSANSENAFNPKQPHIEHQHIDTMLYNIIRKQFRRELLAKEVKYLFDNFS